MVMKKKVKIQRDIEEEPEEEEEETEEVEETEEEVIKDPIKKEDPERKTIASPTRSEIEDMIEGHLNRVSQLLALLRGTI